MMTFFKPRLAKLLAGAWALALCGCMTPATQDPQIRPVVALTSLSWLSAEGRDVIAQGAGRIVLGGPSFDGWLAWNGAALGLGDLAENELRAQLETKMSSQAVDSFFQAVKQNFITQEDFARVKTLGCSVVRLPFSSRLAQEGDFQLLDQAVQWAGENTIYLILDMVPADNSGELEQLLMDASAQEVYLSNWESVAKRYQDQMAVAGYELIHQPETNNLTALLDLYRRAVVRIRQADAKHILFLDNAVAGDTRIFGENFGDNIAFISHVRQASREVKAQIQEYRGSRGRWSVPIFFQGFGGADLDYNYITFMQKAGLCWFYSAYKQFDNTLRSPFFYLADNNSWKKWLSTFAQTVQVTTAARRGADKSLIARSGLSADCKAELEGELQGGESRDELMAVYRDLSGRFPADAEELKRVLSNWPSGGAASAVTRRTVSPSALKNSVQSLEPNELGGMAEALKTQGWAKGQDQLADNRDERKITVRKVCQIVGKGQSTGSPVDNWGSDLGVMFSYQGKVFILGGDTFAPEGYAPNIIGWTTDLNAADGLDVHWRYLSGNAPAEFFPIIPPSTTAPGGAIVIDGVIYIFMFDVTVWANEGSADGQTHGRCVLIKSTDGGQTFQEVWQFQELDKFSNLATIIAEHPKIPGHKALYLLGTHLYRRSPVYLAVCDLNAVEDLSSFMYFSGMRGETPTWTGNLNEALPVIDNVQVGELSAAWNDYLDQWLLSYFDFSTEVDNLYFQAAPKPWGPWGRPRIVFDGKKAQNWYSVQVTAKGERKDWGIPYGGYLLHELDQQGGRLVYFNLSLWVPYSIFVMEADLSQIFQ